MTASFDGASFGERGSGVFPGWPKPGVTVTKKIPGGPVNVIQIIGLGPPRVALGAKCTAAQLEALKAKKGVVGTLIFGAETCTAYLESVDSPAEQNAGKDVYFATLNLVRDSAPAGSIVSNAILLEDGTYLLLEDGTPFLLE